MATEWCDICISEGDKRGQSNNKSNIFPAKARETHNHNVFLGDIIPTMEALWYGGNNGLVKISFPTMLGFRLEKEKCAYF